MAESNINALGLVMLLSISKCKALGRLPCLSGEPLGLGLGVPTRGPPATILCSEPHSSVLLSSLPLLVLLVLLQSLLLLLLLLLLSLSLSPALASRALSLRALSRLALSLSLSLSFSFSLPLALSLSLSFSLSWALGRAKVDRSGDGGGATECEKRASSLVRRGERKTEPGSVLRLGL
jgi:hypothetical protein